MKMSLKQESQDSEDLQETMARQPISHHPADDVLESFARRELPVGMSVIVSAHIEMCGLCRERARGFEAREMREREWCGGSLEIGLEVGRGIARIDGAEVDFGDMIERITTLPRQGAQAAAVRQTSAAGPQDRFVKDLRLPRALRRAATRLRWTRLADGIHQAVAPIDDETRCEFIHIAAGAATPAHSHYGREHTLVLQGRFHDELGSYGSGDFLFRNASHEHQPASDNGCLSFAVLDQPLRFTRGLSRLFNPINRLRFRGGFGSR